MSAFAALGGLNRIKGEQSLYYSKILHKLQHSSHKTNHYQKMLQKKQHSFSSKPPKEKIPAFRATFLCSVLI
ncbi:hypothetical protein NYE24_14330 [Paenibacillus sp. FSL H7-0350]|uniref:hypothetical protein n=1 Tax=Paenibacillus sp. FSL H7-0350 TaxID=2975345 RepID=UPI003158CCF6